MTAFLSGVEKTLVPAFWNLHLRVKTHPPTDTLRHNTVISVWIAKCSGVAG